MEQAIITKKKKWYKTKIFYIILAVLVLGAGWLYYTKSASNQAPKYETVKVEQGNLKQTVDATGNVESANDLNLRFETSGKLIRLYKTVNSQVKKGEVLAELDLSEYNASVAQASAVVDRAKADLNKQLAGNTEDYIAQVQATLDKAKADLEQVQGGAPGVESSKIVSKAYEDALVVLQSTQNTLASSLTTADNILGIDNVLANDDFEKLLSSLDDTAIAKAQMNYPLAKNAKTNLDLVANGLTKDSSHLQIDSAIINAEQALQTTKNLLFSVAEMLNKTVPIGTLSLTELDTLKTGVQTARVSVTTKYGEVLSQAQAIDTTRNTYYSYQTLVDKAQAALNDAKNPPRQVDVAAYYASVKSAEASLSQAVANRNKARIISPIDGVIGKIAPSVGEYVTAQNDVINLVSPRFQVKVDIPETDIIKVKQGDLAEIKLDAYGDDVKFKGTIVEIEKGQTVIQDVVYYRVTVSMEDSTDRQILSGMTANVVFATEEKDNILFIPQRVVRTYDNGDKYVKVLENSTVKEVNVKTGLKGDGGMIEIIEGLTAGQEVIVNTL